MLPYLFDSFSEKRRYTKNKVSFSYKFIRFNSVFGSMVNVFLFDDLTLYLLMFM